VDTSSAHDPLRATRFRSRDFPRAVLHFFLSPAFLFLTVFLPRLFVNTKFSLNLQPEHLLFAPRVKTSLFFS
jgi:hypothetical protein